MYDPLENMEIEAQSYDIERVASIYFDRSGTRAWTKAWFNGHEQGEPAIPITREQAIKFQNDTISRDAWLAHYYPKQMSACANAVEQARQKLLNF